MKKQYLSEISKDLSKVLQYELNQREINRKYFYPLSEPTYGKEEILASLDALLSFETTMGRRVMEFEKNFGTEFGGEAVMVNSGSSADLLIAWALKSRFGGKLQEGDEILVPAITWPTHLWSVLMAGFKVKFVDIDPQTLNISSESLRKNVSPKSKALFTVNLLGNCSNMEEISEICKEFNLVLLEDCCEALGSKWDGRYLGTFGLASSFSFFFSHHLVTMEGGMILTKDSNFANQCRLLRAHGWSRALHNVEASSLSFQDRYNFISWGFNVRPTEIQGAFGIEQIGKRKIFEENRRKISNKLVETVKNYSSQIQTMSISNKAYVSWFAFPIILKNSAKFTRDEFVEFLELHGVETRPIIAGNLAQQNVVKEFLEIEKTELVNAEYINENAFYIGINPNTKLDNVLKVCNLIKIFIESRVI